MPSQWLQVTFKGGGVLLLLPLMELLLAVAPTVAPAALQVSVRSHAVSCHPLDAWMTSQSCQCRQGLHACGRSVAGSTPVPACAGLA